MDIIQVLMAEHQLAMDELARLDGLAGAPARDQVLLQLVQLLSVHEEAEEAAVWSALRQAVGDQSELDTAIDQEQQLRQVLENLTQGAVSADFQAMVTRMREMVNAHVTLEQTRLFPLLRKTFDDARRDQLGQAYLNAKTYEQQEMARLNVIIAPALPIEQIQRT